MVGLLLAVAATGCNADQWYRGGWPAPVTIQGKHALGLWQGSLVAGLAVGGFVLFLIVFAALAYRAKGDRLPRQVKYNIPLEIAYTVVPVVIVAYLFYFTAVTENFENKLTKNPDVTIGVVGFQWNWQFNYVGQGVQVTGRPGEPPKLVLPADETVRFVETSPDVIHSFWVPAFLFKRDVVPGRDNQFEITIRRPGTYIGRCAELCGVDHDRMDFFVQVLPKDQFASWLTSVKAQTPSSQALGAGDRSTGTPQALGPASWLVTEPQSRSASSSGPTRSIVSVGSAW